MKYLAHSPDFVKGIDGQYYGTHVGNVLRNALKLLEKLKPFIRPKLFEELSALIKNAILFHDMGKLDDYAQPILHRLATGFLPNHVDAGTAHLIKSNYIGAAALVYAHHLGFHPPRSNIQLNWRISKYSMRDPSPLVDRCSYTNDVRPMEKYTDSILDELINRHNSEIDEPIDPRCPAKCSLAVLRLGLSILMTADHNDTAEHYGNSTLTQTVDLRAEERLAKLISEVKKKPQVTERDLVRGEIFVECLKAQLYFDFACCTGEVGTGKTTSVMAYCLRLAAGRVDGKARRIIYIAPFTAIISQTVKTYRKMLTLPGEKEDEVVAEHHNQAVFDEDDGNGNKNNSLVRALTHQWYQPIICTTAVQFFESLAASHPSKIKKLHNVPGSIIFVDEAHASLPVYLWPLAIMWLKWLVQELGCSVVFASGSMTSPWNLPLVQLLTKEKPLEIPNILPKALSDKTLRLEKDRVRIRYEPKERSAADLERILTQYNGPTLGVFNTVRNAAWIAKQLSKRFPGKVYHLSTCLTPHDRKRILEEVEARLATDDSQWFLIATACVETGIDFSFRYGIRENCGMISLHQFVGRIRRHAEAHLLDSEVTVVDLDRSPCFTHNKEFEAAARVFTKMAYEGKIGPEYCAEALLRECAQLSVNWKLEQTLKDDVTVTTTLKNLYAAEYSNMEPFHVSTFFKVVSSIKDTLLVRPELIVPGVKDTDLALHSIQLYQNKAKKYDNLIEEISGVRVWKGLYDENLLGYMAEELR